uniref:Uncharacterized protein n=1 Tax=Setaria viridis TaxID=4556 RepID=A0A4U6VA34_SETVI|nr:hypothetical protein SEVIR_3G119300v2 [Setaria viridis]
MLDKRTSFGRSHLNPRPRNMTSGAMHFDALWMELHLHRFDLLSAPSQSNSRKTKCTHIKL